MSRDMSIEKNWSVKLFCFLLFCINRGIQGMWINPAGCDVRTIYFQGIFASQSQIAKYTGEHGFIATTGERVKCANAPDIIYQPYVGKELDEVDLKRSGQESSAFKLFLYYLKRICFPASSIQEVVSLAKAHRWGISAEPADKLSDRNVTESVSSFSICWSKCDFGQTGDVAEHQCKYEMCINDYPEARIILYGASRGAVTTFDAVVLNKYDMSRIKLIVLESCYDSIPSLLKAWYPAACSRPSMNVMFQRLLSLFTGYRLNGISPISLVDEFPEYVPVVFICSADMTIPLTCTESIACAVAQRGKNPVYFLTLSYSAHPEYTLDHEEDINRYLHFMHALYKHLNLPYIQEYALLGEHEGLLEQARL